MSTSDLYDDLRRLDPAAAIARREVDGIARQAVRAAVAPEPAIATRMPGRRTVRSWRLGAPTSAAGGRQRTRTPVPVGASTLPLVAKIALAVGFLAAGTSLGVILEIVLREPAVRIGLAVLGAVGVAAGIPLSHRWHRSPILVVLALWSVAGVLCLTIVPDLAQSGLQAGSVPAPWTWGRLHASLVLDWQDLGSSWRAYLTGWARFPYGLLKVLLYLPAGLLCTLVIRRPWRVVAALVALAVAVYVVQAWSGSNTGSPDTVVANAVGTGLGALLGYLVLRWRRHR